MGITKFGNKRMQKALQRWEKDIIDDVKDVIEQTLDFLKEELKKRIPVDTGELLQSVEVTLDADRLGGKLLINNQYAIYVNYGTGIYAEGPGGSRAKRIPWVYFNDRLGRFIWTHGQRAQFFWEPSVEAASKFFIREMRKIGK